MTRAMNSAVNDLSEAEGDAADFNASVSALNAGPAWGTSANEFRPMVIPPPVPVPSVFS